jgi:hypothetical protein
MECKRNIETTKRVRYGYYKGEKIGTYFTECTLKTESKERGKLRKSLIRELTDEYANPILSIDDLQQIKHLLTTLRQQ